jgi:hypothetical protein
LIVFGAHDRALAVRRRPAQCRHEVAHRLADAGARLQQPDAALVEQPRDLRGHGALRRSVLVAAQPPRDRALGPEVRVDGVGSTSTSAFDGGTSTTTYSSVAALSTMPKPTPLA